MLSHGPTATCIHKDAKIKASRWATCKLRCLKPEGSKGANPSHVACPLRLQGHKAFLMPSSLLTTSDCGPELLGPSRASHGRRTSMNESAGLHAIQGCSMAPKTKVSRKTIQALSAEAARETLTLPHTAQGMSHLRPTVEHHRWMFNKSAIVFSPTRT